jgi:hypothetical protein
MSNVQFEVFGIAGRVARFRKEKEKICNDKHDSLVICNSYVTE